MAKPRIPPNRIKPPSASSPKSDREKLASLTPADKTAVPILKSPEKEKKLVKYIMDRASLANEERKRRVSRMRDIDRQLAGTIILKDKDDRRTNQGNKKGEPGEPVDQNIPLTDAQLQECVTYLLSVFAPQGQIFEALAPADKQKMAQALTGRINRSGQRGQYFRNLAKFMYNAVKYNLGALADDYEEHQGIVFKSEGIAAKKQAGTIWAGNALRSLDMYNFLYDVSVHPVDLPFTGEYFAEVERVTPFRIKKMAAEKKLFGVDRYIDESFVTGGPQGNNSFGLYEEPPSMRDEGSQFSGMHDWRTVFRGGEVKESTPGIELLWYTTWIVPKEHGLADSADMELWRIVVANSKYITFAARLEDSHGMLPVVCATPLEDDLGNEQRTYAEKLFGLQHMSSFLMNSHQAAVRKSIGGITLYNPHVVAGMDLKRKNLIGARIPIKSTATDFDIDKVFRHYVDSASDVTGKALEHLATVDAVMQKILPTDTLKQVASLERATLYQAAATVQAGDRRNYTIACIISDQSMMPLKFMMIFNIYAKEPSVDYVDANGTRTDYAIAKLIEAGIEHYIGTGLKGLDRLMTLQIFRDVLQMVIQSQQALEELDVTQMLNYMMTLAGDNTDLTQFKRQQTEIDQLRSMRSKQPSEASVGLPGGGPTQGG